MSATSTVSVKMCIRDRLGIVDIAYAESNHLKATPYGMQVLHGKASVQLAKYIPPTPTAKASPRKAKENKPCLLYTSRCV